MIDTHCHLTYPGLVERIEEVVARAGERGVDRMISVGTSPEDARRAGELAERFAGVFVAVGIHPHHAGKWTDRGETVRAIWDVVTQGSRGSPHPVRLRSRQANPLPRGEGARVVALGEMGLDRHYAEPAIEDQKRVFEWQLGMMTEITGLPGIIHNREATDETLAMIRASGVSGSRFVFHCFTGSEGELEKILELGAMVSFTGIVTFKNSAKLAAASDRVPLERLMVETDSPYLTPEPYRKVKVNEPGYVVEVARFLAGRRGVGFEEFVKVVDGNAERFFRLDGERD